VIPTPNLSCPIDTIRGTGAREFSGLGITESSEQDRTKKLVGYAAAGIPIYWILDLALRRLEVYRDSGPSCRAPGTGWVEEMIPEGGFVELVIDQRSFGWIAVAENLPQAM